MTLEFENPLGAFLSKELLSIIWNDPRLNEDQKIETILQLVENVRKALAKSLHSDLFGAESPLMSAINTAESDVDRVSVVSLASWYLGENAGALAFSRRLTESRQQLLRERAAGLERLLPVVDPCLLADTHKVEVITSITTNRAGYDTEFLLYQPDLDTWNTFQVMELVAEADPEVMEYVAMKSIPLYFKDEHWWIDAPKFDPIAENLTDETVTIRFKKRPTGERVRLAGSINEKELRQQEQKIQSGRAAANLPQLEPGKQVAKNRHVWIKPEDAWWLGLLQPTIQKGSHLVLSTSNGKAVALTESILAVARFMPTD